MKSKRFTHATTKKKCTKLLSFTPSRAIDCEIVDGEKLERARHSRDLRSQGHRDNEQGGGNRVRYAVCAQAFAHSSVVAEAGNMKK